VTGIGKSISSVVLLTFASTLLSAVDAFVGTWRLNPAKSKYSAREIKDATLVIEEQGDNYQVIVSGTYANGSRLSVKTRCPNAAALDKYRKAATGCLMP
jgi:hypothetical protein